MPAEAPPQLAPSLATEPLPGGPAKLILILSKAGKPIYAWPEEPEGFASIVATASGLLAFGASNGGDLRSIRHAAVVGGRLGDRRLVLRGSGGQAWFLGTDMWRDR